MMNLVRRTASGLNGALRLVLLGGSLSCASAAVAQDVVYKDEEVKAAFLYHFATFVEWPRPADPRDVFLIAVIGADDVAEELERFLPGREIQGRPIQVLRLASLAELDEADVLFLGADHNDRLMRLIHDVGDRPTLVVTDAPGALSQGSMINFEVVDDRVRFEISQPAARRAGLELSSRLLAAAMYVDTTSALQPSPRAILARLLDGSTAIRA